MRAAQVLRSLGPIDVRSIRRDSMLTMMIFIPLFSALVLRWGVPPLRARLLELSGFDLMPYYPVVLSYFFILTTPVMFGALVAFILLDERDDNTLTALQVTPLPLHAYLAYRVVVPILLSIALMFVVFPLANLGSLSSGEIFLVALAAAPLAPVFGLFVASLANNKVEGFAVMKGSGIVLFAPILAFFIRSGWQLAFGVFPSYWPMKVYWSLNAGEPGAGLYVLIALVYQGALLVYFVRRFNRVLHR